MSSNTLAAAPAPNTTGTVNIAARRSKRAIIRDEINDNRKRQRQNDNLEPEEVIARGKKRSRNSRKLRRSNSHKLRRSNSRKLRRSNRHY